MIHSVVAYLTSPATLALAKKLGSVWLFSFVAASGGIIARQWHREPQPRQSDPPARRPWPRRGLNQQRRPQ